MIFAVARARRRTAAASTAAATAADRGNDRDVAFLDREPDRAQEGGDLVAAGDETVEVYFEGFGLKALVASLAKLEIL